MKYFIASDIHGSSFWCEKMLKMYEKSNARKLILLGDLLYHGPRNELPDVYDTKAVTRMLNEVKTEILAVRGNCDSEVDQMVLEFPMMADYAWLRLNDVDIFATHGHLFQDAQEGHIPFLSDGQALLRGHIHLPVAEKKPLESGGSCSLLNPGSVSLPKGGNPNSYALLDEGEYSIFDFSGNRIKGISL